MNADFIKILNIDIISDELSLDDLKGGLAPDDPVQPCCDDNNQCNLNTPPTHPECCKQNNACNING